MTSLTSKKYILRFPALETLMLDDNKLSNPSCFASLAGLRRYCHRLPLTVPSPSGAQTLRAAFRAHGMG